MGRFKYGDELYYPVRQGRNGSGFTVQGRKVVGIFATGITPIFTNTSSGFLVNTYMDKKPC